MISGGAAESLVGENEIFRGSVESLTPIASHGVVSPDWYEIWQLHKLAGLADRVGVDIIFSGFANRVHANHIHDVFDGIDLGDGEIELLDARIDPQHDRNVDISDNIIERTADSGMEIGGAAVDARIHSNLLRRTHGGLRFKIPHFGPVFIYRNVLIDGSPNDIWFSMDGSPAEGYVYQNTVVSGRIALAYQAGKTHHYAGIPRWHFLNNLFVTERGFFEMRAAGVPVNFISDYNVIEGSLKAKPYPNDQAKDSHSRYVDKVELALGFPPKPLPGSAAIDAGLDPSTYFHGKPLPDSEPGSYKGKAPDAGAYEIQ
jgi:hypothetical protein